MSKAVKLLFTGDFCPVGRSEDFITALSVEDAFEDLLPIIKESDISITNLECPLVDTANPIAKTGPNLKASTKTAYFLQKAGFNLVTLANNHIMDYGAEGLNSTLNSCSNASLDYIGAGNSLDKARTICYQERGGLKIAFINFCENEWSTTHGNEPGSNPLNIVTNHYDIKNAKENADYVIIIFHGNNEMYQLPSPRIKELFHFYINSGADFVICHHSHVYSGFEKYNHGLIFYGLGNFLYDNVRYCDNYWNDGIIVQIILGQKEYDYNLIPIRQSDKIPGSRLAVNDYKKRINESIFMLNEKIVDDLIIADEFKKFCMKKSTRIVYDAFVQPYSNLYLTALFKRKLLPSLITRKKKRLLSNIIRCESHRDVLNQLLR